MAIRVFADDVGIWEVHPNGTTGFPWPEITSVSVYASLFPPDDQRVVGMDVSHVSGEYMDIVEMIEGFRQAVLAVAARSGCDVPDLSAMQPSDGFVEIYRSAL
ncbi:hypothetical protein Pth03_58820 [Planotetraspora thailandica]|uniref:Uncharacterized protein n=1 Tax=Planotetraspora thailandica TaxID=487172 RepID=A0A8J3V4Z7_9ACTN|nr:hypothetical protein [Planotetraspora thailandica]GII57493.1 hypothetical protein Pth03_58820 [Planotetraspora thailandica]